MTAENQDDAARVRLLAAGTLSGAPSGARFKISSADFADAMKRAALEAKITIPDRLGAPSTDRAIALRLESVRSFTAQNVIASVDVLSQLSKLAAANVNEPAELLSGVRAAAGDGALVDRLIALFSAGAPPPAAAAPPGKDSIDSIFAQAEMPAQPTATSAVEAFIGAIREGSAKKAPPSAVRQAKTAIEDAVFATASEILRHPAIAAMESTWRGLKLLVDSSSGGEVLVEALDANGAALAQAIEALADEPAFERPDAILLLDPVARLEDLSAWAGIGESLLAPVICTIAPQLLGDDVYTIVDRSDIEPAAWVELRAAESTRWLSVATNRVVLALEGAGAARRVVFGNPAVSVAAALASSFRQTGTFGFIIGPNHALRAPEMWTIASGREAGTTSPVERFISLTMQRQLAGFGVIALGSAKNSDRIVLSAAPTLRRSHDAVPLPAQLLTGRIVRFAQWCREQISHDTPADQVPALFQSAAEVLLFPASRGAATLSARLSDTPGAREVIVHAKVLAAYGGTPFELEFGLGLS